MSYYNRYRNKRRQDGSQGSGPNNGNNMPGGNGPPTGASDAIFDLGKNKRVTVRQFRNINLIDIREYYLDSSSGEMKPGKKGISLTEDLYDELLKHRLNIDEALRRFGSKRPRTKTVRVLSDDEDEEDNDNNASNNNTANVDSKTNEQKDGSKEKQTKDGDSKDRKREKNKDSNKNKYEDYSDSEPKAKRKKPAPPTLLPHEENRENAKREANATLITPGVGKAAALLESNKKAEEAETNAAAALKEESEKQVVVEKENLTPININDAAIAASGDSSDEEFAQSLEAEMNRADDDISEEE
ncbi:chromatin-binding transcription coactivator SUB1 NDAI_0B01320 [Naumovozyma dairenensis CBS 421]|uniref:Transcriptional coactivator p15 (PC4) C-terminal domain-containing protein n=1 Tax=Naumovozyma dairenensis (strain ATCC 10597 / BCRC 20456 / CBS 421 / NBRC 0211 / NRRL Y-12639) TaxID=1071378 RepID=G0W5V5_NAUDC|nr:hypothetical protein NDAI_0B01320 [Naumovozyma dairenensis CBS 421]CCD23166.1 hypothetical protein NDAI_0B01320 [Naumovozyma dairenensis CBS 421]